MSMHVRNTIFPILCAPILWALIPLSSLYAQMGASPGSLYSPAGHLADSTRDLRASQVDDVVTILVSENVSAVATGVTTTSRKSSAQNNITSLAGPVAAAGRIANLLGVTNNQQLAGSGTTSRNLTVSTTVSARVVDVSANGTLTVEGTKDIAVNSEKQTIVVRGLIRSEDLTTLNTVLSTQVANLQIRVNGKGVVGDAIKRPFFLYRLLLGLLPF
jgi:flagellar L-ring protein precursor FlgH